MHIERYEYLYIYESYGLFIINGSFILCFITCLITFFLLTKNNRNAEYKLRKNNILLYVTLFLIYDIIFIYHRTQYDLEETKAAYFTEDYYIWEYYLIPM